MMTPAKAPESDAAMTAKPVGDLEETIGEFDADALFKGRREIVICLGDTRYVLRITRHGKLVLNK